MAGKIIKFLNTENVQATKYIGINLKNVQRIMYKDIKLKNTKYYLIKWERRSAPKLEYYQDFISSQISFRFNLIPVKLFIVFY